MEFLLSIPISLRLLVLFLFGISIGGQLNRGIYRLAWDARDIGPWTPAPKSLPPRRSISRLPVLGWLWLRYESIYWGRGYWIRPMLVELLTGVGLAVLYWLEVQQLVLWPANLGQAPSSWILHSQYLSHFLLICLMIVATFIDLDEQTIPDEITLLGTVAAVALVALLPYSLLPTVFEPAFGHPSVHHLVLTSSNTAADWRSGLGGPASWPEWLDGSSGLAIALAAIWCWGVAVLHKRWTLRYGLRKAICYSVASVVRHGTWRAPLKLVSLLSLILVITWSWGGRHWESTLTSVIGLAAGGALIWAVRLVGGRALNMEAMGFGDVTLMAMIGAFLGWQASFLIFFMAPFSALVIALAQWALSGDRHIAFGPYLCLSAVLLIVNWNAIWTDWARLMFSFGWFIPGMFACCLVLMGGLLSLWRIVRDGWLFPPEESWHEE